MRDAFFPAPYTGPELLTVANRLDRGLDCSRYESMRLLSTVRLLAGALQAQRNPNHPPVAVDEALVRLGSEMPETV